MYNINVHLRIDKCTEKMFNINFSYTHIQVSVLNILLSTTICRYMWVKYEKSVQNL